MQGEENGNNKNGFWSGLADVYKVMYKIRYVDDNSKPFKIYMLIIMAILLIMIGVGFILDNIFTIGFAAFLLFVSVIFLLMNSYKSKGKIQFKVGRGITLLLPFMIVLLIAMTVILTKAGFKLDNTVDLPAEGTRYSYTNGVEVYTGTITSDSKVVIEKWTRNTEDESLTKTADLGEYAIDDSKGSIKWLDKENAAFVLPEDTSSMYKDISVKVFSVDVADENGYLLSDYNEAYNCYTYISDDYHMYKALPLSEKCIKIECYTRSTTDDDYTYGYDVCTINTKKNKVHFKWEDVYHSSFSADLYDSNNLEYFGQKQKVYFRLDTITVINSTLDYINQS